MKLRFASLLLLALFLVPNQALTRDDGASLYARTLLEQINLYRRDNGLGSLRFDAQLARLAQYHSFEMFRQKMTSHRNFDQRFERSGSRMCVENVGWNFTNPLKQFDAWRQSSGHDQNMLKPELTKAGIAEIGNYVTFFACK
ncbi:MAG: CAP domain-containing protein [Proteobacteria bacterium]|nr:CAP domain-containing protein [Pseudomonadota bacterium]